MGAFGGLILTNRGRMLQSKAQTGVKLEYTRIAIGDGQLGSTPILGLNNLRHEIMSLPITKLVVQSGGKAVVGTIWTNKDLEEGFYFREIGIFATDPDVGEILYCYANAGNLAEYVPPGGGSDLIERNLDIVTLVGNATNVTAVIDSSLVYATKPELDAVTETLTQEIEEVQSNLTSSMSDFKYQIPNIVGTQIRINKLSNTNRLFFRLDDDLSGDITISTDGGATSKPLQDIDGNQITQLDKGFLEVVADANFFILRNRGLGGADKQALIEIVNEAERNESDVKRNLINVINEKVGSALPSNAPWIDIQNAISGMTNKRWASGTNLGSNQVLEVRDLEFSPSYVFIKAPSNMGAFNQGWGAYTTEQSLMQHNAIMSSLNNSSMGVRSITSYFDGFSATTGVAGNNVPLLWIAFE